MNNTTINNDMDEAVDSASSQTKLLTKEETTVKGSSNRSSFKKSAQKWAKLMIKPIIAEAVPIEEDTNLILLEELEVEIVETTALVPTKVDELTLYSNIVALTRSYQQEKQRRGTTLMKEMQEYLPDADAIESANNLLLHNFLDAQTRVTTVDGETNHIYRFFAKYDSVDIIDPIDSTTTGTLTLGNIFDAEYVNHSRKGDIYPVTFTKDTVNAALCGPTAHNANKTFLLKALAHNIVISELTKSEIKSIINCLVSEGYLPELNTFRDDIKQAAFRNKHVSGSMSESEMLALYLLRDYALLNDKGVRKFINLKSEQYETVTKANLMIHFEKHEIEVINENTGTSKMVNPVTLYLKSKHRKELDGVAFDPSNNLDSNVYNLFRGFKIEAKEGPYRIQKFQNFVRTIICSADEQMYKIVWSFFAQMFQKPHEKKGTALIMVSAEGTGKGLLMQVMGKLMGDYYMTGNDNSRVTSKFNEHLEQKIMFYANEANLKDKVSSISKLKNLITEVDGSSEVKGGNTYSTKNYTRFVIDANGKSPVEQNEGSRRFINPIIDESKINDLEYYGDVIAEIESDGFDEALMYDLMTFKYSEYEDYLRRPPKPLVTEEQLKERFNTIDNWWLYCLEEGHIPYAEYVVAHDGILSITHEEMFASIKKYTQVNGARMNGLTSEQFRSDFKKQILKDIHIDKFHRPRVNGEKQARQYLYAPLDVQVKHFQTIKKINTIEYDGNEWSA